MIGRQLYYDKDLERKMEQWTVSCVRGKLIHDEISSGSAELKSVFNYIDYHTYSFAEKWLNTMELRDISFIRYQFPWLKAPLGGSVLLEQVRQDPASLLPVVSAS